MNEKTKKTKKKTEFITKTEFAKRVKVSSMAVIKLIQAGKLRTVRVDGRSLMDWENQKKVYFSLPQRKQILYGGRDSDDVPEKKDRKPEESIPIEEEEIKTIVGARFNLEKYKALKAQEEYHLTSGSTVKMKDVEEAWSQVASALKKSIMSLPARIGPLLAGESDPHLCKILLKRELTKCLQDTVDAYRPKRSEVETSSQTTDAEKKLMEEMNDDD